MKKITDLTQSQVVRISDLYRARGATPETVGRVAKTWGIAEADARALGLAATTTAPKRAVTESAPDPTTPTAALDADVHGRAAKLATQVAQAEARIEATDGSLANLTTQQLEALAAAWGR